MRQETNNEMDLLLRRLGRRPDILASGAEDHLDPDELNAYAENAVPAAARARYTEHLAECRPCRDLVVQLSASAGVVAAEQPAIVLEPSGLKKFLASLFSPMVLRFAVPALGLIVVAAIGLFVLRQNSPLRDVAQVREVAPTTAEAPQTQTKPYVDHSAKPDDSAVAGKSESKNGPQTNATPRSQEAPAVADQNAAAPKPESQPVTTAAAEPPRARPAEEPAAKQQKAEAAAREKEAEVTVAKDEDAKKNLDLSAADKRADSSGRVAAPTATAKSKSVSDDNIARRGIAGSVSRARDRGERDDKDSITETRSVAGRTFNKRGGVWIDTAYNSSRDVTPLTRGSEYYRGLIADEPAIKTIAEQLDGEIIVVWKTRTYRIR